MAVWLQASELYLKPALSIQSTVCYGSAEYEVGRDGYVEKHSANLAVTKDCTPVVGQAVAADKLAGSNASGPYFYFFLQRNLLQLIWLLYHCRWYSVVVSISGCGPLDPGSNPGTAIFRMPLFFFNNLIFPLNKLLSTK